MFEEIDEFVRVTQIGANHYIIEVNGAIYFQSYKAIVAKKLNGKVYLDPNFWHYSRTTDKFRCRFLGEGIRETRKKLASGEYQFKKMNRVHTVGYQLVLY